MCRLFLTHPVFGFIRFGLYVFLIYSSLYRKHTDLPLSLHLFMLPPLDALSCIFCYGGTRLISA